jgi:hypothetical protein
MRSVGGPFEAGPEVNRPFALPLWEGLLLLNPLKHEEHLHNLICNISAPSSKKTQRVSIKIVNFVNDIGLILVYSENHGHVQNAALLFVKLIQIIFKNLDRTSKRIQHSSTAKINC